jgi:hypothetical protein
LEVFVGNSSYPTIKSYDVDGAGPLGSEPWNTGNDNLAFDGEGNLWVLQDGGNGHIWVVAPTHTQASPQVRIFAKTPAGSEPTGITFSPDYNFMFVSFQHPSASTAQTDAAGNSVTWNTHTTVVIARTSVLGPLATLPVSFTNFSASPTETGAVINWSVSQVATHDYFKVERSVDGNRFETIHTIDENIINGGYRSYSYTDNDLPASTMYYRVKQCDIDGRCQYTDIKTVKLSGKAFSVLQVEGGRGKLSLQIRATQADDVVLKVYDMAGREVHTKKLRISPGTKMEEIKLKNGSYVWEIRSSRGERMTKLTLVN